MTRLRSGSLGISIVGVLLIVSCAKATSFIVFRYDDLSADRAGVRESNEERSRIWKAEQEMDSLFGKYRLEYVVSVIPKYWLTDGTSFTEDCEKTNFIKRGVKAGRIEIALHGFSHTNYVSSGRKGEFRGRGYKSQLRDITLGKEILCESFNLKNITIFVPPYNGWDNNTATILKQLGFTILSADRHFFYKSAKGLTVIPATASLKELEALLNNGSLPEEGLVVVL